ncbi:MAG TPA: hypothetical protein PLP27_01050 [Crocinitomicaceae bacterium]|nr:hypothetical protein [Crocinitomicaceae bacterium]
MMNVKQIDIREQFQQLITEFSAELYPQHAISNLQCHEPIDEKFDKGFVLFSDDKIRATACVIKNEKLAFKDKKAVCIAYYECVEDVTFSTKLLQTICDYCQKQGYSFMIGPLNGSTWKSYRFAVNPITDSYFSEPFHKAYYTEHFEKFGFEIAAEYVTQIDKTVVLPKNPNSDLNENISFRTLDKTNFETELKNIYGFCKEIFHNNFLYTDIDEKTFLEKYLALKDVLNPEFVLLAEHNGEIVGLLLALHDYYCQTKKRIIVKTLGRKSGTLYTNVVAELSHRIIEIALKHNYQSMLHAFMIESNTSKTLSSKQSGELFRRYKLYCKAL